MKTKTTGPLDVTMKVKMAKALGKITAGVNVRSKI